MCSVATDLVTWHQFHSSLCYNAVPFLANYGTIAYSLIFTPIVALLQAVLQANTEPFRNGLVERRNKTLKTSRNHSTGPKWSELMLKYGFTTVEIFPSAKIMATLRNKRKLAAMARETQEYSRNNQSQNSAAPGITEDYTAQVSEEIGGRVNTKLSQEFSRTESRILGALSKLDEFLLNPQIRIFSGTVPRTFRNAEVENQEPSGDRSQNDLHSEMEFCACRASNLTDSDPDKTFHRQT